jgi:transketolase
MIDPTLARLSIDTIRALSMDAVQKASSGHPGTPMALAPAAYALFTRYLRHNPANPGWLDRDRFVLSCGHASMLLYSMLHLTGYDLSLDDLKAFRQWGSRTPGHPEAGHTPGVETTTGPLGQGLANAVGMAIAERLLADRFNRPGFEIVSHRTWVFCSDGDLMEGVASEAASLAGHLRLGRLVALYDDNRITIEGFTSLAFSEDVGRRFESYGWQVLRVDDSEQLGTICRAFEKGAAGGSHPTLIILRSRIGFPSPGKTDSPEAHGSPLGEAEIRATKKVMGWPQEETFRVPPEVSAHMRETLGLGLRLEEDWNDRFRNYQLTHPDLARELLRVVAGELPAEWDRDLVPFTSSAGEVETRKAGGAALNAIAPRMPELVGGSADLSPSTNTTLSGGGDFGAGSVGRNFHWGIREHAMASAMNGMALHGGVRPFGATFLVFADYCRPALRLAALMKLPTLYVFTHDSIGVGEDGPTHQPVETIASLRIIPGFTVLRPADANETVEAWRYAAGHRGGPVLLALTRQKLPVLDLATHPNLSGGVARGAYVLAESGKPKPDAILIGTGSEVHLALAARKILLGEGIDCRVVSMPSWELFAAQPAEYRARVLPAEVHARVAVEAGVSFGWCRWLGERGVFIGLDRFGASAPAKTLYEKFGITAEAVAEAARRLVRES